MRESRLRAVRAVRRQDRRAPEEGHPEEPGQCVRIKWSEMCYTREPLHQERAFVQVVKGGKLNVSSPVDILKSEYFQ